MLILGREIGQSVVIGEVVKVTLLQMGSKLKLSVEAPKDMAITKGKTGVDPGHFKKKLKRTGEMVRIGSTISVTILQTESGLVRLAIDAPREVSIYREELFHNQVTG